LAPLDCENCAVIDRAYSKKVCVCVLLCKATSRRSTERNAIWSDVSVVAADS